MNSFLLLRLYFLRFRSSGFFLDKLLDLKDYHQVDKGIIGSYRKINVKARSKRQRKAELMGNVGQGMYLQG